MKVRLATLARLDLIQIGRHIAADSPGRADRFVAEIRDRCQQMLSATPERGARIGARARNLRRLRLGSYLIIYQVQADEVMIVRVVHGARDLSALFGDEFD